MMVYCMMVYCMMVYCMMVVLVHGPADVYVNGLYALAGTGGRSHEETEYAERNVLRGKRRCDLYLKHV